MNWIKALLTVWLFCMASMAFALNPSTDPSKNEQEANTPLSYKVDIDFSNKKGLTLEFNHLKKILLNNLSLLTKKNAANLNEDQLSDLVARTPSEIEQILRTEGYFNSTVDISEKNKNYQIVIDLKDPVTVNNTIVVLEGPIEDDDDLALYYKELFMNWPLTLNEVFTQDAWQSSKRMALSAVNSKKYLLAEITHSEAFIDPNAHTAILTVYINSRQAIQFGHLNIEGTERYPENVVSGMATFKDGNDYDADKLLDFQHALEQDSHYSHVMVKADLANIKDNHVPIDVKVTEVPRQKVDMGLSYDLEDGVGVRMAYDHYNMFKRGYTGSVIFDVTRYVQELKLGMSQPRDGNGHFYTGSLNFKQNNSNNLESSTLTSGFWRARIRDGIDSRVGVEYFLDKSKIKDGDTLGMHYVTLVTASWKRAKLQTNLRPRNGYYLSGEAGSSLGSLLSSTSVLRLKLDSAYYFTPNNIKLGTWSIRGTAGYIKAANDDKVPSSLKFRTGGASSIRGYKIDSIGIDGPNDSILGGNMMLLGSIEYQYPIKKDYALALFHDMGDVQNSIHDFKWKHASGIGVRWFNAYIPLAFDVAYAHQRKKIAWYINLGARF